MGSPRLSTGIQFRNWCHKPFNQSTTGLGCRVPTSFRDFFGLAKVLSRVYRLEFLKYFPRQKHLLSHRMTSETKHQNISPVKSLPKRRLRHISLRSQKRGFSCSNVLLKHYNSRKSGPQLRQVGLGEMQKLRIDFFFVVVLHDSETTIAYLVVYAKLNVSQGRIYNISKHSFVVTGKNIVSFTTD